MADQNSVIIPVEIQTGGLDVTLNDLKTKLTDLTKKFGDVSIGSKEFQDLKKQIDDTNKSIKESGVELDSTGKTIGILSENVKDLIPGVDALGASFGALGEGLELLSENPILITFAAIAAAAVVLVDVFKDTEDGATTLAVVGGEFNDIWIQVKQILIAVATAIADVLVPIIEGLIQGLSDLISFVTNNIDLIKTLAIVVGVGAVAFGAYTLVVESSAIASGALAVIQGTLSTVTGILTGAQIALNVAMDANPVGAIILLITGLVAIVVTAYEKSEVFRGIIDGLIEAFTSYIRVGKDVVKILGGIGEAIIGIITLDPAKIKEGLADAAKAGEDIGKTFQEGFQKGVDEIKNGQKSSGGGGNAIQKAKEESEAFRKASIEKQDLMVQESDLQAKIAKLRLDAQKGVKGADEEASKAEEDYNGKVLKNRQALVDYYKYKTTVDKGDEKSIQGLRDAQIDLNSVREKGYQDQLRISRAQSRGDKTAKSAADKAKKDLQDKLKNNLTAIVNADNEKTQKLKANSDEYYASEEQKNTDELAFYKLHKTQLFKTDAEYNQKRLELEKNIQDLKTKNAAEDLKKQQEKEKTLDQIALIKAKTAGESYNAQRKILLDQYNEDINQANLTAEQKLLIQVKYDKAVGDLNKARAKQEEDSRQKRLSAVVEEDDVRKSSIEKEVGESSDKLDRLGKIEQKIHDDKLAQLTDSYNSAVALAEQEGQDTSAIKAKYNADKMNLDQQLAQSEKDLAKARQQAQLDLYDSIGKAATELGDLLGKKTAAAKALAIASAVINTYEGVTKALATGVPPESYITAAITLASGLATVAKIVSTKVPGSDSGGGSAASSTPLASSVTSFSAPQLYGLGGTKVTDSSSLQQTTKVIVTDTDITRQQNRSASVRKASVQGA